MEKNLQQATAFAIALGWLINHHHSPWRASANDAYLTATLAAIIIYAVTKHKRLQLEAPTSAIFLFFILIINTFIGTTKELAITESYIIPNTYLIGLILLIIFIYSTKKSGINHFATIITNSVFVAAFLNSLICIAQWYGLSKQLNINGIWIIESTKFSRTTGNIGQSNNLATIICLGIVSAEILTIHNQINRFLANISSFILIFAIYTTGSRTGTILAAFALISIYFYNKKQDNINPGTSIANILFLIALRYIEPALTHSSTTDSFLTRTTTDLRYEVWNYFLNIATHNPFTAYGINGSRAAYISNYFINTSSRLPGNSFSSAHNLFIDILIWFSLIPGLFIIIAIIYWSFTRLTSKCTKEKLFPLYRIFFLLILAHSMTELPYLYGYMLAIAGTSIGILESNSTRFSTIKIPIHKTIYLGATCAFITLSGLLISQYTQIENLHLEAKLRYNRVIFDNHTCKLNLHLLENYKNNLCLEPNSNQQSIQNYGFDYLFALEELYPTLIVHQSLLEKCSSQCNSEMTEKIKNRARMYLNNNTIKISHNHSYK